MELRTAAEEWPAGSPELVHILGLRCATEATTKCAALHVDCFELKLIMTSEDTGKDFYLSLNCLKEFGRGGPVPGTELLPETMFYMKKTYLHGLANIFFVSSC